MNMEINIDTSQDQPDVNDYSHIVTKNNLIMPVRFKSKENSNKVFKQSYIMPLALSS